MSNSSKGREATVGEILEAAKEAERLRSLRPSWEELTAAANARRAHDAAKADTAAERALDEQQKRVDWDGIFKAAGIPPTTPIATNVTLDQLGQVYPKVTTHTPTYILPPKYVECRCLKCNSMVKATIADCTKIYLDPSEGGVLTEQHAIRCCGCNETSIVPESWVKLPASRAYINVPPPPVEPTEDEVIEARLKEMETQDEKRFANLDKRVVCSEARIMGWT